MQVLASMERVWGPAELVLWPLLRLLLVPLTLLAPRLNPSLWLPLSLTATLGLTSGLFGRLEHTPASADVVVGLNSLPLILAGGRVRDGQRELAGNLMTFSYCLGLTLGAGAAYACAALLPGSSSSAPCLPNLQPSNITLG